MNRRIERVKQQLKQEPGASQSDGKLTRAASDIIANRDAASADYLKRYFNIDWHDPCLYHLVLNLGMLDVDQAVQIIAAATKNLEIHP